MNSRKKKIKLEELWNFTIQLVTAIDSRHQTKVLSVPLLRAFEDIVWYDVVTLLLFICSFPISNYYEASVS